MDGIISSRAIRAETLDRHICSAAYAAIFLLGALLFWLSARHPSLLPVWAPWDFSTPEYLATSLTLFWFARGFALATPETRLPAWRCVFFLAGLGTIYAVLQTRIEYLSQHMFYINRLQHVAMHHIGPFLIAIGCAGQTIKTGMPTWARNVVESRFVTDCVRRLQQPILAVFLFVGLFFFWLIPAVHFRAMLDWRLYALMNWSMVLDGLLFWSLVLDPRPQPPARLSFGARAALSVSVIFPQIVFGAVIAFSTTDLYPYYDLCGRIYASVSALDDQHLGGVIIWIPPAMMSAIGAMLVINALRIHDDSTTETDEDARKIAELASRWTGR